MFIHGPYLAVNYKKIFVWSVWHGSCNTLSRFVKEGGAMVHDGFVSAAWFPFLPGSSWAGLLVWLLVMVGLIGFFVSLRKR